MLPAAFLRPDVLVLAGGGIVGEAWMDGVLAGIEDGAGVDFRRVESFVGTSAGSIVAARLAAGRPPRRPSGAGALEAPARADSDGGARAAPPVAAAVRLAARWGWAATAPLVPLAMRAGVPAGAAARAAVLGRGPAGRRTLRDLHARVERWGTRFDGRLRVCCVDRRTGRRVVFGAPGAPSALPADAVIASCSIPWVFEPVTIGGREYVDGGAWSFTNLDAAPARGGTHVLCLDPAASLGASRSLLGTLRRAVRAATALEMQALRRRGAHVHHIAPDAGAAEAMGVDFMAPAAAAPALAAGYRQGRALVA